MHREADADERGPLGVGVAEANPVEGGVGHAPFPVIQVWPELAPDAAASILPPPPPHHW
jgi:hypothetical protein